MDRSAGLSLFVLAISFSPFVFGETPAGQPQPPTIFNMDKDRQAMISLDGLWRFHPGEQDGNLRWADLNFDDSSWPTIRSTEGWSEPGL